MPGVKAVLFDFDYTLADSSEAIVDCVNHALVGMGLSPAEPEAIHRGIGLGLVEIFQRLTGLDGDLAGEFRRRFIERADEVMSDGTHLYPWVPDTLHALRDRGLALGIVSTKRRHRIAGVLERDGLAPLFGTIVGADMVERLKPDPEPLLLALDHLGAAPGEALYVGDSMADARAAAAAGVPFAGVLTGTTPREELASLGAVAVLDSAAGVPALLEGLRARREGPSPPA